MSKKLDPETEALLDAIKTAQALALSTQYIVREMLADVARLHAAPDRYLADLYERVARKTDPQDADLGKPEKKVYGDARTLLADIFGVASNRLRSTVDQG